jgi:hypothetical protein
MMEIDQELTRGLVATLITPVDCEDMQRLSTHAVSVVRTLEKTPPAAMDWMAARDGAPVREGILGCSQALGFALASVTSQKLLREQCERIHALHTAAMATLRDARRRAAEADSGPFALVSQLWLLHGVEELFQEFKCARTRLLAVGLKNG